MADLCVRPGPSECQGGHRGPPLQMSRASSSNPVVMQSLDKARRLIEPDEVVAVRRGWHHVTLVAVALLAFTGIFACVCDAPMIWDGAYQFAFSLIKQRPYFYLTRFHSYVLWLPMVWLSRFTDNLTVLKFAYGLPFTLAP